VVNRRYIVPGYVNSLTSFFAVPKGTEDIRVVYDATKSGLNAAIWTPNFMLPTATSILNNATERTFFGDIDLGEMFLNFFLDKRLRPLAGVDLGVSLEEGKGVGNGVAQERRIMRWERSLMGVKSSPFNCVRAYLLSEDIIKGDHLDPNNPFRWDSVVLNLPGTGMYDPVKPWIYKYDEINGKLSSFVVSYVDDLRTGDDGGKDGCDKVTHHVASFLNYLGEQDAARKRGSASQQPGAWAGSVIESRKDEGLFVTISQEKWTRVKTILEFYREQANDKLNKETVLLDYKRLEQDTGFLVHVFMTYENLRPYLKGFYLTLNEWRFDRDEEGWKVNKRRRKDAVDDWLYGEGHWELESPGITNQAGFTRAAPKHVRMVPQMERDVELLSMLFNQACPSKRLIRGVRIARILYGFGDASGAGFGAAWEVVESEKCDEGGTRKNETTQVRYCFG
jgi:hypothetical protein